MKESINSLMHQIKELKSSSCGVYELTTVCFVVLPASQLNCWKQIIRTIYEHDMVVFLQHTIETCSFYGKEKSHA